MGTQLIYIKVVKEITIKTTLREKGKIDAELQKSPLHQHVYSSNLDWSIQANSSVFVLHELNLFVFEFGSKLLSSSLSGILDWDAASNIFE